VVTREEGQLVGLRILAAPPTDQLFVDRPKNPVWVDKTDKSQEIGFSKSTNLIKRVGLAGQGYLPFLGNRDVLVALRGASMPFRTLDIPRAFALSMCSWRRVEARTDARARSKDCLSEFARLRVEGP